MKSKNIKVVRARNPLFQGIKNYVMFVIAIEMIDRYNPEGIWKVSKVQEESEEVVGCLSKTHF